MKGEIAMQSSLASDVRDIIDRGVYAASASVNQIATLTYWRVGRRIVEEIKRGENRAEYGSRVIAELAAALATKYGGRYSKRNLDYFCQFYRLFPDFEIVNARVHNLSWTHYRLLLGVINDDARYWYMRGGAFIMELGRGFSFVARQQHIVADGEDFFIDLVFYNFILKCFFLVDLKTGKLTHKDVGQMDMYVRMYDDLKRTEGDNPTIGLLLCADTSRDIARYSVLHESKQLFAAKYLTYLPSEEELRREIERQKEIFAAQHGLPMEDAPA